MPSLYNQQVAQNYNKAYPSTNLGGRELVFLVLSAWEDFYAGDPALSAIGTDPGVQDTGGYNRLWTEPGSRFEKAVNGIQQYAELFFLGEPTPAATPTAGLRPEETFVFAIAVDTRSDYLYNDEDIDPEISENPEPGTLWYGIKEALGHSDFNIYKMDAVGDNLCIQAP